MKIAIIAPKEKDDYLLNDCIDGLFELSKEQVSLVVRISPGFVHPFSMEMIRDIELPEKDFIDFAKIADIIILGQRKGGTNFELADKVGLWRKTVFLDGSELGANRRFDFSIQDKVLRGQYEGNGRVDVKMLTKCAAYFRREKPYLAGTIPFPYSIQSQYLRHYDQKKIKDIDFVCIFGQDEFPSMRRFSVKILEEYCKKNGFTFRTGKTKEFDFSLERKAGRDEFYDLLSRAKVGISIGGGGFDTVRFWETLANNCLLITERVDIFQPDAGELDYQRIYECNNLYDFKYQLEKVGEFLKSRYRQSDLDKEYQVILQKHSSKARMEKFITLSLESIKQKISVGEKCAIVVSSCDKYSDLWNPFFTLFFRYWPDCPFPVYLVSNTKIFDDHRVKTVPVGDDKGWASNIKTIISSLGEEYILYMQEDYFLQSFVDTEKIKDLLEYMSVESVGSIRLIGSPEPKHKHSNPFGLCEVKKKEQYRVSLQGSLWNKNILLCLLKDGESGWDMEREGSIRSNDLKEVFLSTQRKRPILDYYYYTAIKKGMWMPGALRLLRRENIKVDVSKRGVRSEIGFVLGSIKNTLSCIRRSL